MEHSCGIVLFHAKKILLLKYKGGGHWDFPKGHIEKGESETETTLRELREETGIKNVELIKELDDFTTYKLPTNLLGIIWKGKYKGQKQKWFVMRFLGNDDEINIKTKRPEFLDWKWIELDKITDLVVKFKLDVYKEIKKKIKDILN